MALFSLPSDLTTTNDLLRRIADALERAYPPIIEPRRRLRGPEAIIDISSEAVENRQKLDTFLLSQGLNEGEIALEKQKIDELPDAVRTTLLRNIREGI